MTERTVEAQLRAELRLSSHHAHETDARAADAEAALLEAQAATLRAEARAARAHATAVTARATVSEVRRLCDMTIAASIRVQAIEQARDTLAIIEAISDDAPTTEDDAWGSVWLHGKWSWLTKNMTTPEREYAADCVARWSARLNAEDGESDDELEGLRWWREA
jgi:hypothetical protein